MPQPLGDYDERYDGFEVVGEQRQEEGPYRPERRLPKFLLSGAVMAVFAGGLWFAYHEGTRHPAVATAGGVPLIRADQHPDKIKPNQPGGMQIPDQNVSIYDEKPGAAPVEKLLPPPEKPLPRPAPEPPAAPAPAAASATEAQPTPAASNPAAMPPPPQVAPAQTPAAAAPPSPARPTRSATTIPARSGAVQVRLASVRTPEAARSEWARLKRDNADLLGNLSGVAVRTDLGEKGIYYRVEAGPFDSTAAAERVCSELKKRGLGCILAR